MARRPPLTISFNLRRDKENVVPSASDASADHVEPSRAARARVAATSFAALFAIVGLAFYGLPFYYDFMVRDFGWSRAQVTSGNALSKLIVGPLLGFAAGWIIDRFGPRRLMIAGILMAGVALIGLASMRSLTGFYVFYLCNAIGYVCGGPLPNQVLLSRWFTGARGRAMGFAYLGIGAGGALVPLASVQLVHAFGWHGALRALGILIVVIALPFALTLRESPSGNAAGTSNRGQSMSAAPIGGVLRRPAFYLLIIGSMCSIAAVGSANQNLKLFLSLDRGYTQGAAASVASLILATSLVGRLGMGWLADRWPKKHVMLLIYLLVAGSLPILLLASTPNAIMLFAVVFGLGLGGEYMVIPLMAAELFGVRVLGRAMGIVLAADGVAEATAPVLIGHMRDVSGGYAGGFLLLIGFAVAGTLVIAMLPRGAATSVESTVAPAPEPA
jgi:MFS family permease